jgi:hypothetical protein
MYFGSTGFYIVYLELELSGKLMGNFNLVTVVNTPKSSTRMMYQKSTGTQLTITEGKSQFKDVVSSFTDGAFFTTTGNIMPEFPTDAKVLMTITMGSVVLNAQMAFVVDMDVTGSNTFTAQSGARVNAQTRVALYIFQKGAYCVAGGLENTMVHSATECTNTLTAAGVTQAQAKDCTSSVPANTDTTTYKCLLSKYLVAQVFERPTFKTGLNGPSLKAKSADATSIRVSVYPVVKVSAYKGMFALFAAPELKVVIDAKPSGSSNSSTCEGVQISVSMIEHKNTLAQLQYICLNHVAGPSNNLESNLRLG